MIQKAALRALLHCRLTQRNISILSLHTKAAIPYVKERLKELANQYFINALLDNNPIINKWNDEFRMLCAEIPIVTVTLIGEANIGVHDIVPLDLPLNF